MKEISNRSATFHFAIEQKFVAGMVLLGTEIKSIRQGRVSFNDSFCFLSHGELWIKSLHIAAYSHGTSNNHEALRDRKLLLTKRELKKILAKTKEKGFTIIPLRIFLSESGFAKIEIALARGKKLHDKRDTIKNRDVKREIDRELNR
ncbi:MAG: SsrA-binding protein SmpB [Chitinophagaceae bacterium]